MLSSLLAIALSANGQQEPATPGPDDIVVVARRKNECVVQLADKVLNDAEFRQRSKRWAAGEPARVFLRNEASRQCRVKILYQLAKWDVRVVEFVDPGGRPATPEPVASNISPSPLIVEGGTQKAPTERRFPPREDTIEMGSFELRVLAGQAAHLILRGDCAGAMKLVLDAGDLDAAFKVATICRDK
ncbi:MAG: hypothetical protein B7Y45_06675 [Sphingomonas sp. 28-66-16]|nr:MAG: hypothetical protein B7Y45_06675 [Sphingomonas sp. 28-66-16]